MHSKLYQSKGFTLVELMITVAIISILAAVAYPSYSSYVQRGNRTDLQGHLLQLATSMEQYKSQQLSYSGATLAIINNGSTTYPSGAAKYDLTLVLVPDAAPTSWTLLATPTTGSSQVGDGALQIDSKGRRCWNKASDTTCDLDDATQAWSSKAK